MMRALMLKNWYIAKRSMGLVLLILAVWAVIPMGYLNVFAVIYGALLPTSFLAYDRQSRWDRYARMLPYSPRQTVLSYYVSGWITIAIGAAACALGQLIMRRFTAPTLSAPIVLAAACIGCLILAVCMPLNIRFGPERGRLISGLAICLVCGLSGAVASVAAPGGQPSVWLPAALVLAPLALAATAVSLPLAVKAYGHAG